VSNFTKLFFVLGPAAHAALAFKYSHGQSPMRVHHLLDEFRHRPARASPFLNGFGTKQFVTAEVIHALTLPQVEV
jgi:hypothetical protein